MAQCLGITQQRLAQLVKEGRIKRTENGRYNPFEVVPAYCDWLRSQKAGGPGRSPDVEGREANTRKKLADARTAEIDLELKQKLYVYKRDHLNAVSDLGTKTRLEIERADFINKDQRRKLILSIQAIEPMELEPAK